MRTIRECPTTDGYLDEGQPTPANRQPITDSETPKGKIVLGGVLFGALLLLGVLSLPLLIGRYLVRILAKWTRSDLDEMMEGPSAVFANEYFLETPTRSNIVVAKIFQGQFTYQEVKRVVQERWIKARDAEGRLLFEKFQQHPVRWMFYTFWKWDRNFSVDRHVTKLSGKETLVTERGLNKYMETILNSGHPKGHSPWEMGVLENYQHGDAPTPGRKYSVLILKTHHCLGDGYSLRRALTEHLFDQVPHLNLTPPQPRPQRKAGWRTLVAQVTFPFRALDEFSFAFAQFFQRNPWKIRDADKKWYQVYDKTGPIPLSVIKDIKNKFGVSFTSVLLSAISSALRRSKPDDQGPLTIFNVLPVITPKQTSRLTNQLTGCLLRVSIIDSSPVARLKEAHRILTQIPHSAVPVLGPHIGGVLGSHCYPLNRLLTRNQISPMCLSNFPGSPVNMEINGKPCVDLAFIGGGLEGDSGIMFAALSHSNHISLGTCAERGLLSKSQLSQVVQFITAEIRLLHELSKKVPLKQ